MSWKSKIFIGLLALLVFSVLFLFTQKNDQINDEPEALIIEVEESSLEEEFFEVPYYEFSDKEDQPEEVTVVLPNRMHQMNSAEVNYFLSSLDTEGEARMKEILTRRLGTPYKGGCLGEGSGIDPDPIFRLDVSDCTVFVLTSVSLYHSSNLGEAENLMKILNYYPPGIVSYENRLHFTTHRNKVSAYFTDITRSIGGNLTNKKTVLLNKEPRLIKIDFEKEVVIDYIPSRHISRQILESLPSVVGVAFLRDGDENIGLDVRHEGFIVDGKKLIHASLSQGRVVEEDFLRYISQSSFDGIILFKVI